MININKINYSYDSNFILKVTDLNFEHGTLNFIVGPNGSGKTTLLKLLNDQLDIQDGNINIDGKFPNDLCVKKNLLYLSSGDNAIPDFLSCYEFIRFMCKLYEVDFNENKYLELVADYKMNIFHKELIENYSHGMKKKVLLIASSMVKPKILIIDETLNGIDIEAKIVAKRNIFRSVAEGQLTIIATHDLNLVEEIGSRIVLILNGAIFYDGDLSTLKENFSNTSLEGIIQMKVEETYYD